MRAQELKPGMLVAIGNKNSFQNKEAVQAYVIELGNWNRDWKLGLHLRQELWYDANASKSNVAVALWLKGEWVPSVVKPVQVISTWSEYQIFSGKTRDNKEADIKTIRKFRAILNEYRDCFLGFGINSRLFTPYDGPPNALIIPFEHLERLKDLLEKSKHK